jgi:hypothetical protein
MKVAYVLYILAAVCGIITAYYWYRASKVGPLAAWDFDPKLKPKNMVEDAWGRAHAGERAQMISGRMNKIAAAWAMAGALLTLVAVLLG